MRAIEKWCARNGVSRATAIDLLRVIGEVQGNASFRGSVAGVLQLLEARRPR